MRYIMTDSNTANDFMHIIIKIICFYYIGAIVRHILSFGTSSNDGFFRTVLNVFVGFIVFTIFPYILVFGLCTCSFIGGFLSTFVDKHFEHDNGALFDYPVAAEELFVLGCCDAETTGHACFCK